MRCEAARPSIPGQVTPIHPRSLLVAFLAILSTLTGAANLASVRVHEVVLALPAGWLQVPVGPHPPKGLVARFVLSPARSGGQPAGRLYRIAGPRDVAAMIAATPSEDPHAFDQDGPRRPHRLAGIRIGDRSGLSSWTVRHDLAGTTAYVRRDVVITRQDVGYRLVLDLSFNGDEHVAHAFGIEASAIVASWRWVR